MIAVILFKYHLTYRPSVAADTVLQFKGIVKPPADYLGVLRVIRNHSLRPVYAEAVCITQPSASVPGIENREDIIFILLGGFHISGKFVAPISDGYAVQILVSLSFPGSFVLGENFHVDKPLLIHAVKPA